MDPLPEVQLIFDCPKCGGLYPLAIVIGTAPADEKRARWHVDALPGHPQWFEHATIVPSVKCHPGMHGPRGPICSAHFTVINGNVTLV